MKPESHLISSDDAINYFVSKGYSLTKVPLANFEAFDEAGVDDNDQIKYKKIYDEIFTKNIANSLEFFSYSRVKKSFVMHSMSVNKFSSWLENWWYDDDLILVSENGYVSVFHHSGYVFYLCSPR